MNNVMNKFKNILLLIIAFMMTLSCVVEEVSVSALEKIDVEFMASFAQDTKTMLVDGTKVYWLPGDKISVYGSSEKNVSCLFSSNISEPLSEANFLGTVAESDTYCAVYPLFNLDSSWNLDASVPVTQQACLNGFVDELNISVAKTSDMERNFVFQNVLGYVKFTISNADYEIKSVTVRSNNGEQLSGWFAVDCNDDELIPEKSLVNPADCFPYVQLNSETALQKGDYYIAMIPGTYKYGLTFTFENADGDLATKVVEKELSLRSNEIQYIGTVADLDFVSTSGRLAREREILMEFYESTGGDNWKENLNWGSDKPVREWYGVTTDEYGFVTGIGMLWNDMSGTLPNCICELESLKTLAFQGNSRLGGAIPEGIWDNVNITHLGLQECSFSGEIPDRIANLKKLQELRLNNNYYLSGNILEHVVDLEDLRVLDIRTNQFSGTIPGKLARMWDHEGITVLDFQIAWENQLTGEIPSEMIQHPKWKYMWGGVVPGDGLTNATVDIISAPEFELIDIKGRDVISSEVFAKNKLTLIYQWDDVNDVNPIMLEIYEMYKEKGLEIISIPAGAGAVMSYLLPKMEAENHTWITCPMEGFYSEERGGMVNNMIGNCSVYPTNTMITVTAIDSNSKMLYSSVLPPMMDNEGILMQVYGLVVSMFGEPDFDEDPVEDWTTSEFYHRSVMMRFTADWCGYCPSMATAVKQVQEQMPDKVEALSVHGGGSNLACVASETLLSAYPVDGFPTGCVDGVTMVANYQSIEFTASMIADAVQQSEEDHDVLTGYAWTSSVSGSDVTLNLSAYIKEAGSYKVTALLVEDKIIGYQYDYNNGSSYSYEHNGVIRASMSDVLGDSFTVSEDCIVKEFTYSATIPSECNQDNMRIVVYVQAMDGSTWYIDNSATAKLGVDKSLSVISDLGGGNEGIVPGDDITL